jgi:hypothetical protein
MNQVGVEKRDSQGLENGALELLIQHFLAGRVEGDQLQVANEKADIGIYLPLSCHSLWSGGYWVGRIAFGGALLPSSLRRNFPIKEALMSGKPLGVS